MADHPAIVALAKVRYDITDAAKRCSWDNLSSDMRGLWLADARAAYAAVLKDLMEPSEAMKTAWSTCPSWAPQARHEAMLRARAREIGVEV